MYKIPNFFRPKVSCDLIRVGSKNDGGYVIPKSSINEVQVLISFGLSDDWKFEQDFQNLSKSKVICYDHSVNKKFWIVRFIKNCIAILMLKNIKDNFKKIFTYFQYLSFFKNSNAIHEKKFIAPKDDLVFGIRPSDKSDLNEILINNSYEDVFLKIDIEGSEYRILDQIVSHQKKINSLAIEFHDCDLHFDRIKKFIDQFALDLVHIHVNNYSSINHNLNPSVIELTFSSKKHTYPINIEAIKFPIEGLDAPCNKNHIDKQVLFY